MKTSLNHVAIRVDDLNWYQKFFETVFDMEIRMTRGDAPARELWFVEGIQLIEDPESGKSVSKPHIDHVSLHVQDVPAAVAAAIAEGCSALPNGAHWFALPNGIKIELK